MDSDQGSRVVLAALVKVRMVRYCLGSWERLFLKLLTLREKTVYAEPRLGTFKLKCQRQARRSSSSHGKTGTLLLS